MKKIYNQPEIEVIIMEEEEITTAGASVKFDPNDLLGGKADDWFNL